MGARSKEHPLLRTLVLCGASLVGLGCGGRAESDTNANGGRASVAGAGGQAAGGGGSGAVSIRCPEQCESPAQFVCAASATATGCRCDETAPPSAAACETVWDFNCKSLPLAPDCAPLIAFGPSLACTCAEGQLHPEDCERTSQFTCAVYQPAPEGCRCVPDAPQSAQECPAGMQYSCYERDPDIGCSCARIDLIK